jgi:short-subunit dehydrogenase
MKIEGATVLVTGASGGIGTAIARRCYDTGAASVVASGRRSRELEELCRSLGARARPLIADLAEPHGLDTVIEEARHADVVVASAGLPASGKLTDFSVPEIERAVLVNLTAVMAIAAASLPHLIAQKRGHLVFVSSLSGKIPAPGGALYNCTKAALRMAALSMRDDLRGTGVGVSVIYPGFISGAGMWAETGLTPPRGIRTRTPEQVAAAVLRAIERNKAEIDVAPLVLRVTARVASLVPLVVLSANRRAGYSAIAEGLAVAHRAKR